MYKLHFIDRKGSDPTVEAVELIQQNANFIPTTDMFITRLLGFADPKIWQVHHIEAMPENTAWSGDCTWQFAVYLEDVTNEGK